MRRQWHVLAWLVVAAGGCYSPKVQQDQPCDPTAPNCPIGQTCQASAGGFVCSSSTLPDDAPVQAVDAPVDAHVGSKPDAAMHDAPNTTMPPDAFVLPITYVQSATVKPTSTPTMLAFDNDVGDHRAIIVCLNFPTSSGAVLTSITDTLGNNYQPALGPITSSGSIHYIAYALDSPAGADTVTVTLSAAVTGADLFILEYGGLAQSGALDQTANATGNSTAMDSGSATTTYAHELVLGYAEAPSATAGSGFTMRATESGNLVEDETVYVTGSYDATATTGSGAWTMMMATFKGH